MQFVVSTFGQLFLWTVPFLIVLGVVVIVHELGHFLAARALGISVETFSIGFGPEIFGFYDKKGTRWRLAWIPLGGYVKFKGDETVASMPSREKLETLSAAERVGNFHTAPLWRRTLIVLAGPFSNFFLSFVIFTGIVLATGIVYQEARIDCVVPGEPAAQAGLQAGDKVLSVSGANVKSFEDFKRLIALNARSPLDLVVDRGGKQIELRTVPELTEQECVGRIGVVVSGAPENIRVEKVGIAGAAAEGLQKTWILVDAPLRFFGQLFHGNACSNSLGGPVKIASITKTIASEGFINLIPLIAFISASVGLFNLFPIPVLDGGHLLFYGLEAILGKPLSQRAQEIGFQIGFALILMLMVFVTWNNVVDLTRSAPPAKRVESVCRR